jgi:hypothetical protein
VVGQLRSGLLRRPLLRQRGRVRHAAARCARGRRRRPAGLLLLRRLLLVQVLLLLLLRRLLLLQVLLLLLRRLLLLQVLLRRRLLLLQVLLLLLLRRLLLLLLLLRRLLLLQVRHLRYKRAWCKVRLPQGRGQAGAHPRAAHSLARWRPPFPARLCLPTPNSSCNNRSGMPAQRLCGPGAPVSPRKEGRPAREQPASRPARPPSPATPPGPCPPRPAPRADPRPAQGVVKGRVRATCAPALP